MKDYQVLLTGRAEADLLNILTYIGSHNTIAGDGIVNALMRAAALLGSQPEMGRVQPQTFRGKVVRGFPVLRYLIIYTVHEEQERVEIIRFFHSAQDPSSHLADSDPSGP